MYGLTNELAAAQISASPNWSVAVTTSAIAPDGGAQGEAWQIIDALPAGLSTWDMQGIAHDTAASANGLMRLFLSHADGLLACQWCAGADDQSATFTAAAIIPIAAFTPTAGIHAPKPALVQEGGRWHAYYLLPDGCIYHRLSSNQGDTWSVASTVYGGGDAVGDLFAIHLPEEDMHVLQFARLDGVARMKGAARTGNGAWTVWVDHAASLGWLPAGMATLGSGQVRQFWHVTTAPPRSHHFGYIDCTAGTGGALVSVSAEVALLHTVAGESPIHPALHAAGRALGGVWYTAQLRGARRTYATAGRIHADSAAVALGEALPVHLTPLPASPLERHNIPVERGDHSLLVGLATVCRSAHRNFTATSSASDIIAYRSSVRRNQGEAVEVSVRCGAALAETRPDDVLWLTRTCRKGTHQGSVTLGYVVTRVEASTDRVRLHAVDALGMLGESLTPLSIPADAIDDTQALQAICAWAGVRADVALAMSTSAPAFGWRAGERGLTALLRYLRRLDVRVRSRVNGAGVYPNIRIDNDAQSVAYTYGNDAHPLIKYTRTSDARARELVAVRGVAVRNQPEEGEDWALASVHAAQLPGRKGAIVTFEDRTLAGADIADIAHALAHRLDRAVTCEIVTQANLALEVHDWVVVQGETFVVEAIVETWEERRCIQHVELSPVEPVSPV